ncbi:hypothetical protein BFU36_09955 [Sulfolobus sp. A20]|uniref:hypothetical protein n=1 Tax=Saccharolobus sp. A20 TaxID=1891280 RepID=UPI000845D849|nr:hypothetical protein [Sulfolobus sp. A20]TRM74316.1 hypothetical protein DJ523_05195 [Sulfolobus sp. E5]TRM77974.1 hypothetical protein DJ532_02720 [Sulfolobus sp. A20-N-F8]TRM82970.1 hypothetical protein DJ531_07455 [Sulfolobus sp. A20-N-F6]TRM99437.1 hypothetical protein DJ530_08975 [Sulfolobus sp. E1]AOL16978.1 hypothetical protein BFU36_09955 [Sulfolobus sp. A20]
MNPFFLEYKVIDNNITYYIIYVFISNISLKIVSVYVINPYSHTILNYNASIEPEQIFSNVSGNAIYYHLNGNKILAYSSDNGKIIVAYNGLILKKENYNSIMCLVSAHYPGISNSTFPNLDKLAGISLFNNSYTVLGSVMALLFSLILFRIVTRGDRKL